MVHLATVLLTNGTQGKSSGERTVWVPGRMSPVQY